MAITAKVYASFPENLGGGNVIGEGPMDLLSDVLKVMLTTNVNGISQTADTIKGDITNEITGTNYVAGGYTLLSKTYAVAALVTTLDAADPVWSLAAFTAAQSHFYDDTIATPVKPLLSYADFGGDQSVNGADFTLQLAAAGILTFTAT